MGTAAAALVAVESQKKKHLSFFTKKYRWLTLYWAQDGRLFTSCRAENFKMEDQKWACVLNMEYQWNACMDLNAINCKMCRNEFERDLSDLSMFFYSGFHIYPGECQSHTHKTKSLFFYT